MKTKTKKASYGQVMQMPRAKHKNPPRPSRLFATIIRVMSHFDLKKVKFTCDNQAKETLKKGPCLILMNHSSFIDLEIASKIIYPRPYNIVCTSDGFVGKEWLMRAIGCIPTQKFVTDLTLIRDIKYALKKGNHVLMYPEASYSFDGKATPLPRKLGALLKMLNVPVVTVITKGAFAHDPLYNCLQKRKVKVSASAKVFASAEEVQSLDTAVLDKRLDDEFSFDNFAWQYENKIEITEPFRADGLERILYKCPNCKTEGKMVGKGIEILCEHCGKRHILNVYGRLEALDGETVFAHIPDWYNWQRECVKDEIAKGTYLLDTEVEIGMMVNYKAIYMVGSGRLTHDNTGFTLTGASGELNYKQGPLSSYSLYADYYWYELGDIICIGNKDCLYYCFPKKQGVVSKTRIATEELFKLTKNSR
ncbi:MAG: 1-acyl-sn-glycerol-3-phosphate acyltransferase [Clostridia bacterium]|nr:1-acyl-sn-glycerol-3-phosphate acyltransferase [Clostridia bacterium]